MPSVLPALTRGLDKILTSVWTVPQFFTEPLSLDEQWWEWSISARCRVISLLFSWSLLLDDLRGLLNPWIPETPFVTWREVFEGSWSQWSCRCSCWWQWSPSEVLLASWMRLVGNFIITWWFVNSTILPVSLLRGVFRILHILDAKECENICCSFNFLFLPNVLSCRRLSKDCEFKTRVWK